MNYLKRLFDIKRIYNTRIVTIFGIKFKKTDKIKQLQNEFKEKYKNMTYKIHKYCPVEKRPEALKDWYYEKTCERLDLENPKTFNEKIQWLKLYDSTPLKTKLADKYLVRDWVKEKIGEEYLIPLLGVWDKADDIDFDKLPNQFVLKCNHGCGYNIIVKDKTKLDKKETLRKLNHWMQENYAFRSFEMHYSDIPRKIMAEEYISNGKDLYDYKIWCFNGEAKYIQFLSERQKGLKMAFYDRNWNKQDFVYSYKINNDEVDKPHNLDELLLLAEKISKEFAHVRVDFYILNDGSIKFGEMTFTSYSGACKWEPQSANIMMGNLINIEQY